MKAGLTAISWLADHRRQWEVLDDVLCGVWMKVQPG
jgi:hypothetical protein